MKKEVREEGRVKKRWGIKEFKKSCASWSREQTAEVPSGQVGVGRGRCRRHHVMTTKPGQLRYLAPKGSRLVSSSSRPRQSTQLNRHRNNSSSAQFATRRALIPAAGMRRIHEGSSGLRSTQQVPTSPPPPTEPPWRDGPLDTRWSIMEGQQKLGVRAWAWAKNTKESRLRERGSSQSATRDRPFRRRKKPANTTIHGCTRASPGRPSQCEIMS